MLIRAASRFVCLVLAMELIVGPLAYAQQDSTTSGNGSAPAPSPALPATGTGSTFTGPLSDYVPCIFSDDDELSMRAQPSKDKTLDATSADLLFNSAKIEIEVRLAQYSQTPDFVKAFQDYFSSHLYAEWMVGNTVAQAISKIKVVAHEAAQDALAQVQKAQRSGAEAGKKGLYTDQEVRDAKQKVSSSLASAAQGSVESAIKKLSAAKKPVTNTDAISAARQATDSTADSLKLDQAYRAEFTNLFSQYATRASEFRTLQPADISDLVAQAAADADGYPFPPQKALTGNDISTVIDKLDLTGVTQKAAASAQAKQFQPPNDVSCSMAVMSWKETRDIFGRRVANTFIAIQVTLRNLNTKNEFLVHDIQVAVDTGVTPDYFGRFQAGRDKLLVRAVAQRGQSDDRRNVVLNTLQTVGAIAAASSLVGGTIELKDAVAVFQGAFLTGFANIFPDHTVEQLNHINDLVFSASNTSKVVVPVQGSVPLVTFISEKPIEQLPFAWCGRLPRKGINPEQFFGWGADRNCNFNGGKHNPGYVTPYRYNRHGKQLPRHNPLPSAQSPPQTLDEQEKQEEAAELGEKREYPVGPTIAQNNVDGVPIEDGLPPWDDLKYKDWRGAAVRMLQEHTFVVVGGVHIQEVVTQPRLANLSCPQLTSSKVDLSQTDAGKISCTVSGSGLSLITAVNLQKDNDKKPGSLKPNPDGNTAAVTFDPKDLCSAEGDYSLFVTYKSDTQKDAAPLDTGNKVSLAKQPAIDGAPTISGTTLTWNGKCMDQIRKVALAKDGDNKNTQIFDVTGKPTDTQATATVTTTKDASYQVGYKIDAQSDPVWPKPTITVKEP